MSEPRTIKKYPNRRLYDTVESRYITLADIRRLVIDRIDFVVMDKKTQEDITRSILLQVIAEQEHGGEPLMSRDFLSQIIRSYGGAMQGMDGGHGALRMRPDADRWKQDGRPRYRGRFAVHAPCRQWVISGASRNPRVSAAYRRGNDAPRIPSAS